MKFISPSLKINEQVIENLVKEEYNKASYLCEKENINDIDSLINSSKILKMICFETLLECMFMRQKKYFQDEMNNSVVKTIIFNNSIELSTKFSLNNFNFNGRVFFDAIKNSQKFYINKIEDYFLFLLKKKCQKYILDDINNLKGHIIFRYFDYREKIEYELAKMIWKEAKRQKISVLTYVLPKGEVGLLPSKSITVKIMDYNKGELSIIKSEKISIDEELSTKYIMRNPCL